MIQKEVLGNAGNESFSKINTTEKSTRFNQYFDVSVWEILFLKYMNTQKNLKVSSGLLMYMLLLATHAI